MGVDLRCGHGPMVRAWTFGAGVCLLKTRGVGISAMMIKTKSFLFCFLSFFHFFFSIIFSFFFFQECCSCLFYFGFVVFCLFYFLLTSI